MADTGRIDDIINVGKVQEQIKATNEALDSIIVRMVDIAKHSEQIKMDFGGLKGTQALTKALHEVSKANQDAEKANKQLNESLAKQAILQDKLNKSLAYQKATNTKNNSNTVLDEQTRLQKKLNDLQSNESRVIFQLKKEIADLTAKRKHHTATIGTEATAIVRLEREVKLLTIAYDKLSKQDRESASGMKLQAKIHALNQEIRENKVALSNMKANVGNYAESMTTAGKKVAGFTAGLSASIAALAGTFYAIKKVVDYNSQLADSMADVRKTTGMTEEQVRALNEQLRGLNTRTAQNSLLDLGVVAGKLGVPINEVAGFIKAADMIGVAMGRDLGDAEEAVNALGKMVAIFKVNEKFGFETALIKVGSALRMLGNDSTATEQNIIEFTKMFGGIGPIAGLNIAQVMGLGATLDQLGHSAEVSSTALSQMFLRMFKNQDDFARVAKMSFKDFSKLLKTDVNEAFIKVLQGLNSSGGGLEEVAKKMAFLGTGGRRVAGVLSVLSTHIDILRHSQELSRKEMDKGTALMDMFNIKNDNMAASLAKAGKAWKNFLANSGTVDLMTKSINGLADAFQYLSDRFSDDPLVKAKSALEYLQKQKKIGGSEYSESSAVGKRIAELKILVAGLERQRESELKLAAAKKKIADMRKNDVSKKWSGPYPDSLDPMTEDEILTKAQEKAQEKEAAAAARKAAKEQAAIEKLNNTAEKLIEKSYEIRVELGLVSLDEQEENEKASLQKRIDELNAMSKKQGRDDVINWQQANEMKKTITLKYIDKLNDLEKAQAQKMAAALNVIKDNLSDNAMVAETSGATKITENKFAEKQALRTKLSERNITIAEYRRQEKEINEKYDIQILNSSIAITEKLVADLKLRGITDLDLENKLANAKIAVQERITAATVENIDKRKQAEKDAQAQMISDGQALLNSLGRLVSALYDGQIQKIDETVQANQDAWDRELADAQGNSAAEKAINQNRAAQEKKLSDERKKMAHDQAVANKVMAGANAVINTAVGVTGALAAATEMGPVLAMAMAILIGLAGAAEVATIIAEPIPSYKTGREGGPQELAKVHPGEIIKYPGGEMAYTPNVSESLAFLPAGADVIPAGEVLRMAGRMSMPGQTGSKGGKNGGGVFVTVENPYGKEMLQEMKKDKTSTQTTITDTGDRIVYKTGNHSLTIRK